MWIRKVIYEGSIKFPLQNQLLSFQHSYIAYQQAFEMVNFSMLGV